MTFARLNKWMYGCGGTELNTLALDVSLPSHWAVLISTDFSLSLKRRIIFMNLDSRKRKVVGKTTLVTFRFPV